MSNWGRRIKCRPRRKGKYEFDHSAVVNQMMFVEANKTLGGKGHFYKMHIVPCGKCGKKFKINKDLKMILNKRDDEKICPMCAGITSKYYLMVSEKEQVAIARLHEAKGCTVRKMTDEEKRKYNLI